MTNTKFNAYTAVKLQCDFDYGPPRHLQRARKREVPRATLQRARSAKFPAQETMFPFIFTKNRVIYHFVNDI